MFNPSDITNGKLLPIPCVQFSFSDDNSVLSESVEGLVNMITVSVGSVFLPNVTYEDPLIQGQ
jgi:DNA-directed RNA polymerase-5 subunit 1